VSDLGGPANTVYPPFWELIPGAPGSPVILHVPHASRALTPAARAGILLDDAELEAELDRMTDTCTDVIARRAAGSSAWLFINRYSRLVVDPERFPDDREEMRAVGMGAVYTHTSLGDRLRNDDPSLARTLLSGHFRPYAEAFTALVDDRLAATGRAVIVDVHSYPSRPLPYELHGDGPRPPVCIGTDPFHTPPALIEAATDAFGSVGLNSPFAGCYVPTKHYRSDPRVAAIMVEIRRDTYLVEPAGPPTGGLSEVSQSLARMLGGKAFGRKGFSGDH
jgi:N-formylglutamate amidohydrolase